MKIKKIKWGNLLKLIVFVFCIGVIIHDFYMLTLYSFITGKYVGWTWFGLATFILACGFVDVIYEDFRYQIKKMSAIKGSRHLK